MSREDAIRSNKVSKRTRAMITKTRLVHLLVLVLACMSVFRLVHLAITTSPHSPVPSLLRKRCIPSYSACHDFSSHAADASNLTIKELKLLTEVVSHKAPCNLLIFGLEPEYLVLSEINSQGTTIILEDNPENLRLFGRQSNNTRIHKVEYGMPAKQAYSALKQARKKPGCWPHSGLLEESKCRLALTALPKEVYRRRWDVIIVDGPSSDSPDAPGRMPAIYSASLLARSGNRTNVLVHDVDRVIEKWFSWEFLCEDNLVSSRGKFWNFLLEGANLSDSTSFCSPKAKPVKIHS